MNEELFTRTSFRKEAFKREVIRAFTRMKAEKGFVKATEDELVKNILIMRLENDLEIDVTSRQLKHQLKTNRSSYISLADTGNTPILPVREIGGSIKYLVMFWRHQLSESERLYLQELSIAEHSYKESLTKMRVNSLNSFKDKMRELGVPETKIVPYLQLTM